MRNDQITGQPSRLRSLKAVASAPRLTVLHWLKNPTAHFPPQVDGDLITDGVCSDFIREKLGVSAATASRHLTLLAEAGLVVATRKKGWTFYRRNESTILEFVREIKATL